MKCHKGFDHCANEDLIWDSVLKKKNPGGDCHPGWGGEPKII